jgi:methionyl-tRNA formyltransferase
VRVVFWGTPEFATPSLRALLGEGFDVVAVVTQPDRAAGRWRAKVRVPPVKQIALDEGLPVLQPERPRGEAFVAQLTEIAPDLSVVVAYGHILPRAVIDVPRLGTVNVHASLLPQLRGAAPIQAAIREGFDKTGITVMRVVAPLDAGPMIVKVATPVAEDETYGELALRLSEMGALALIEALSLIELGQAVEVPQDDTDATYAPKVDRETTRIDWTRDARSVCRVIRAYDPRPGALTTLRGREVKLFGARYAARATDQSPGEVATIDADGMVVACGGGALRIAAVQAAGKRRMSPSELARGRGLGVGDRFGVPPDGDV